MAVRNRPRLICPDIEGTRIPICRYLIGSSEAIMFDWSVIPKFACDWLSVISLTKFFDANDANGWQALVLRPLCDDSGFAYHQPCST